MSDLSFYYSTVGTGKTNQLIQAAENYKGINFYPLVLIPDVASCMFKGAIKYDACAFNEEADLYEISKLEIGIKDIRVMAAILVDDAHFLTPNQVLQLATVSDDFNIPVNCYGLRTDFMGVSFDGSEKLLRLSDNIHEIPSLCACGKKATMNIKHDNKRNRIINGEQVEIGGNEIYTPVCRFHFFSQKFLN